MAETSVRLPVREAYKRWAPVYDVETAITSLEDRVVTAHLPSLVGKTLLDLGCGNGRRLPGRDTGIRRAVGMDLVTEMLLAGRHGSRTLAAGDVRALPFRPRTFDMLWCRLALGHVPELSDAYREFGRVAQPGAELIVSDFHPAAVAAGHDRTFRDTEGTLLSVEHHVHSVDDHGEAASAAGWTLDRSVDALPGDPERPFYEGAGRLEQLAREVDLPLVLVMCFHR